MFIDSNRADPFSRRFSNSRQDVYVAAANVKTASAGHLMSDDTRQFKSDCHQTWSVIPLAIRNEAIKFWKVKVVGGGLRSTERPSS